MLSIGKVFSQKGGGFQQTMLQLLPVKKPLRKQEKAGLFDY